MAEFKFSCPQCGQHIQCDTGYVGAQINCPSCQQSIVVPQAPHSAAAPPAMPAPPPAPVGLSTRQSTTVPATGRRFVGAPGAQPPAKPKSKALKTVLVVTASVVVLAGLVAGGWFGFLKYKQHKAAQGNPAAQVPTPTATAATGALDILSKVQQTYTNLTSLSVKGTSTTVVDLSQVTAADLQPIQNAGTKAKNATRRPADLPKGETNSSDFTIRLGRPDLYRIEAIGKTVVGRMTMTNLTAVWSSGQSNYWLTIAGSTGAGQTSKQFSAIKDRKMALAMAGQSGGWIPQLFFDGAQDIIESITDLGQTGDESVSGQDCYTLVGKATGQKVKIWVDKSSYMVRELQITLGGAVSEADISKSMDAYSANTKMTPAQIEQMKAAAKQASAMMVKMRGTVTETYDDIETNNTFTADDFVYPVPRGLRLTPSPLDAAFATTPPPSASSSTEVSQRNACINNLRQIDAAKNEFALEKGKKNGDPVTEADIKPYIKLDASGNLPKCPAGGKYTIGKVGELPTCSIPGHALP
jgi:outer membrane lipoprotein-sorting protein